MEAEQTSAVCIVRAVYTQASIGIEYFAPAGGWSIMPVVSELASYIAMPITKGHLEAIFLFLNCLDKQHKHPALCLTQVTRMLACLLH